MPTTPVLWKDLTQVNVSDGGQIQANAQVTPLQNGGYVVVWATITPVVAGGQTYFFVASPDDDSVRALKLGVGGSLTLLPQSDSDQGLWELDGVYSVCRRHRRLLEPCRRAAMGSAGPQST